MTTLIQIGDKMLIFLVPGAGENLAYITLPKSTCYEDAKTQIEYIQAVAKKAGIKKDSNSRSN